MGRLLFFFLLINIAHASFAQSVLSASGGTATGSSGNISFSYGQTFGNFTGGTNGSITEGVQQSFALVSSLNGELSDEILNIEVYPNPSKESIQISNHSSFTIEEYQLFTISGKLIQSARIGNIEQLINIESLPSGTYFLKLLSSTQVLKDFKIIKTN